MRMHGADGNDRERLRPSNKDGIVLAQYLHELTVFPNSRHDDQVDSTP
jgi:hypothetical protein